MVDLVDGLEDMKKSTIWKPKQKQKISNALKITDFIIDQHFERRKGAYISNIKVIDLVNTPKGWCFHIEQVNGKVKQYYI